MATTYNPGRDRLLAIEGELNTRYLQRPEEIRGLLLALLSNNHIEMLGPPGTAKSMLTYDFQQYIIDPDAPSPFFNWLLTKFTTVEEIMGPVSIQGMKEDKYRRITTSKLPEARFAYLDEVYKANSPLLNSLLSILQERIFYNNGGAVPVPLQMCVGSSNELPDEDEGLSALRDRFLLRYQVQYIQDASVFSDLLRLQHGPKIIGFLEPTDLDASILAVSSMPLTTAAVDAMTLAWERLREHGIVVSDRRFKNMVRVMAAQSWLTGEVEITSDSLVVGEHILWDKPEQFRDVKQIVRSCVDPNLAEAEEFLSAAREGLSVLKNESTSSEEQIATLTQIRTLVGECRRLVQSGAVASITSQLESVQNQVIEWMSGSRD